MRAWLQRFMQGRYGQDQLNRAINWVALALLVVSLFVETSFWYILAIAMLIYSIFRMFSRNHERRGGENQAWLSLWAGASGFFRQRVSMLKQRKTHRFYRCPNCRQWLRVPKGAGKISVHCPKCGTRFERNA